MITINKGISDSQGNYSYTCHACGFASKDCPYCYGRDMARCRAEIKTAKGQRYYALLKTILHVVGKDMVNDVKAFRDRGEKFSIIDIAWISLKYDLNFKATCEWLEETNALRAGVYTQIQNSRTKIGELYAKARAKYAAENY